MSHSTVSKSSAGACAVNKADTAQLVDQPLRPALSKVKDSISLLVTALPLIGAIGTIFVWVFAYVYVGNVQIVPEKPFKSIFVQVFSEKGNQSEFHTPQFQLMPGSYFMQVSTDEKAATPCNVVVRFHEKTVVALADGEPTCAAPELPEEIERSEAPKKKRWWQFWRK
jgi:hypothetical protein